MFWENLQVLEDEVKKIQRRPAKKITKLRLKNIGLYYLERFESSVGNLRQVLMRRVNDYAYQNPGYDTSEALGWIEELLADFERYGYLNDNRFAELKIRDYLAAGKSARYIKGKLLQKGISEDETERLLAEQEYNPEELALKLAKKKKIGPFRGDETARKEYRQKDLAVLVRAGFDYAVAQKVLGMVFDDEAFE